MNRIDLNTDQIKRYTSTTDGLTQGGVTKVYTDAAGDLWVEIRGSLNRYNREEDRFEQILLDDEFKGTTLSTIFEDSSGRYWIGTREKGVYLCDHNMNVISHFTRESKICR